MGEVYVAELQGAAGFSRQVIIKRILPHLAADPQFVRKFIDEARLMVQLHHGNIIRVEELNEEAGELFIVMEYLPGRDLRAIQKRMLAQHRTMPADLAAWLLTEVCAGLDYAHHRTDANGQPLGLVHRDVSPSNILVGPGGEIKITDFGIASARGCLHESVSGVLQGKFLYMSPEQAEGKKLDARSDLFSAALILYELLSGHRPFEADSEVATLKLVREANIPPIDDYCPDIDPELAQILHTALALNPDDRYSSAGAFSRAILTYLVTNHQEPSAAQLVEFTSKLFPEGFIESASEKPLSLDDAFNLELGALSAQNASTRQTPSISTRPARPASSETTEAEAQNAAASLAVTRRSGLFRLESQQIAQQNTPGDSSGVSAISQQISQVTPAQMPQVVRASRFWPVTTVVVALTALAFLFYFHDRPQEGYLDPTVTSSETPEQAIPQAKITVDGKNWAPKKAYPANRWLEICASAEGYERQCQDIHLEHHKTAQPRFELQRRPTLEVVFDPPDAQADVTLNGSAIELPYDNLTAGSYAELCVLLRDPRFQPLTTPCRQLKIESGKKHKIAFQFELLAPVVESPDAAVPDPPPTSPTPPAPPKPGHKQRSFTITSTPAAQADCGSSGQGPTPLTLAVSDQAQTCQLTAPHYAPRKLQIPARNRSNKHVTLQHMAQLTLRAMPAYAWIYLDGQKLTQGLYQGEIPPGPHLLEIRHEIDGHLKGTKSTRININPNENKHLVLEIEG